MKASFAHFVSKYFSSCFHKQRSKILSDRIIKSSTISQTIFNEKTQEFINELKVKNLIHYTLPSVDANELIIDSLKSFQNPFKLSVLVMEEMNVVGTLHLSDVMANLKACNDLNTGFCSYAPVRSIMSRVFVPMEFYSPLADIIVDILNSESQIHPVYDKGRLKGVLYKDTILDIAKLQMLEEAVHI